MPGEPRSFAQTNIQLWNQMLAQGYSTGDIERVASAYALATEIFVGLYRGSAKPLLSHLVGTASIVAACKRPAPTIAAALLHAALADGDFGRWQPRRRVSEVAGADVAILVDAYHTLKWSYESEQVDGLLASMEELDEVVREAVLIRIANEIEDYLDLGAQYHGSPEGGNEYKGAQWRIEYMSDIEGPLTALAGALGERELKDTIRTVFSETRSVAIPASLRSGHRYMWFRAPSSYRPTVRHRIRRVASRLRRVRQLGVGGTLRALRARRG